jgi:hypothetical protein
MGHTCFLENMGNSSGPATFSALFDRWAWRPIPNCPGRYVLAAGPVAMSPEEIATGGSGGSEHETAAARDPVIVTPFDDGGLISYRKMGGTFLHTLNTREGLDRKLRQLGIRS